MTLHEAIVTVLRNKNQRMKTQEIADELNELGLYSKKDGSPITAYQIHGRTKNYSHLFTRDKTIVGLVEWGDDEKPISNSATKATLPINFTQNTKGNVKIDGDTTKISFLKKMKFKHIGSLGNIIEEGLPKITEINQCGLYSITIPYGYKVDFIPPEDCRDYNVINPWTISKLKDKWVNNVDIVYYGIAGKQSQRSLRQRLMDLIKHGSGKITDRGPHKGGEILWQLKQYEKLFLWILPTEGPPTPRNIENTILHTFNNKVGKLPFANRQF